MCWTFKLTQQKLKFGILSSDIMTFRELQKMIQPHSDPGQNKILLRLT